MIDIENFSELFDANGDAVRKEGEYNNEHMHVQNPEDFIDIMRDDSNEEETFDEDINIL